MDYDEPVKPDAAAEPEPLEPGDPGPIATEPVFRTVLPDGVAIVVNAPAPDGPTTAAAAGILVAIAGSALVLAVRRRTAVA